MQVNRVMPGWESLETVSRLHGSAQIVGLMLLVALAGLAAFAAYKLRKGLWPEWLDVGQFQIRSRFLEIACAVVLALLLMTEVVAYAYGRRAAALNATAAETFAEQLKRLNADTQALRNKPRAGAAGNAEPVHQGKFRAAAEADRCREQGLPSCRTLPDAKAPALEQTAPVPDRGAAAVRRPEDLRRLDPRRRRRSWPSRRTSFRRSRSRAGITAAKPAC